MVSGFRLAGRGGPIVNFILKALMCCLWCLEKVLKFINWNAYIMIGKGLYTVSGIVCDVASGRVQQHISVYN